ncbi:MAG: ABC transporter ATP-binding protein [Geminicoccaceae bacterium]
MTQGLVLEGVGKCYGTVEVLKPLDLEVGPNEFLTILGPSGSGKTTILRLVGGFTEPSAGRISLGGQDITTLPINRRPCHTVFQDYALFPHMTVAENVGYGLLVRGTRKADARPRIEQVLEVVGLGQLASRYPAQLSGGQRQRTALARAIVLEPKLVLLDEPLGALDAELRRQMQGFLKALQRRIKTAFLFVTHDQEEAITMSDRIVVMRLGAIEQVGTPQEIYWRPRTAFVAGFFGDNNLIEVQAERGANGMARIAGPLGTMNVPATPGTRGRCLLALRPESLTLLDGEPEGDVRVIVGEAADLVFTGGTSRLMVKVPALPDQPLRVQLTSRPGGDAPAPGSPVRIAFRPREAAVVPA